MLRPPAWRQCTNATNDASGRAAGACIRNGGTAGRPIGGADSAPALRRLKSHRDTLKEDMRGRTSVGEEGETILPVATFLTSGQIVDTQLTVNCSAQTRATFDLNDSTWITLSAGTLPLWKALLSIANQHVILDEAITALGITLSEGLTITFNPLGGPTGTYTVLLYGTIIDSGTPHVFEGASLGVFSRNPVAKRAVEYLRRPGSAAPAQA